MATYGFDRLLYGFTRNRTIRSFGDPQDWVVLTNHLPAYTDAFIGENMYQQAPMLDWAVDNVGARSWDYIRERAETGELSDQARKVAEFNRKMGVIAGYTISFHSVHPRYKGVIALTARKEINQSKINEVWAEHGQDILVMNNVAHLKILTLPNNGPRKLTKRQKEVLGWIGDGKTIQDTAILLGLTPATVEKHLRLARRALDVETTAQAVLRANFHNQIFLVET